MSKQVQGVAPSDDAEHGSRVHELLRIRAISGEFNFNDTTSRERDDALACWALVEKLLADMNIYQYEVICAEERLYSPDGKWSGQPDLVLKHNSSLVIIDYKTGRIDVEQSASNTQLQALAVLAHEKWKIHDIVIAIISPNATNKISAAKMTYQAIQSARLWIEHVVESAMKPDAALRPGEPQCRYCPAKSICPELAKWAVAPVEKAVPQAIGVKPDKSAVIELARALSLEQCAEIWARRQAVQWVYDAIEERLQSLTDEQLADIGLERVPGRVIRTVRDARELFSRMKAEFGMDSATFTRMCVVNMGQLEEWLAEHADMSKAQAKKVLAEIVADLCDGKQTKPTIKPKQNEKSQNQNH